MPFYVLLLQPADTKVVLKYSTGVAALDALEFPFETSKARDLFIAPVAIRYTLSEAIHRLCSEANSDTDTLTQVQQFLNGSELETLVRLGASAEIVPYWKEILQQIQLFFSFTHTGEFSLGADSLSAVGWNMLSIIAHGIPFGVVVVPWNAFDDSNRGGPGGAPRDAALNLFAEIIVREIEQLQIERLWADSTAFIANGESAQRALVKAIGTMTRADAWARVSDIQWITNRVTNGIEIRVPYFDCAKGLSKHRAETGASRFSDKVTGILGGIEAIGTAMKHSLETSAKAAIMSRNLSHNVGSHALANPKLHEAIGMDGLETRLRGDGNCPSCKDHAKKNPVQETKTRLSTFHQYIQTRLDFIARTLNPQVERTEPLFFVNDVLNGFFRQTVLLDTLLADRGFPMKTTEVDRRITFHVTIELEKAKYHYVFHRSPGGDDPKRTFDVDPNKTKRWYREGQLDAWKEKKDQGSLEGVEDVLVGVPGGMIGCHALYSFLENLMRNAAKYGAHCEDKTRGLEVHLRLREATQCDRAQHQSFFVLESWENLNDEPSDTALSHIRTHLGKDLIDPEGNTAPSGHGIQEMKIAAEFLSGKAKFHADDPDLKIATPSEYCAYVKGKSLVQTERALRCFRGAREFGIQGRASQMQQSVIYELLMPKARLVGIVNTAIEGDCDGRPLKDSQSVFLHREVSSLAKDGAAFGVILDTGQDENAVSDVVNKVVGLHHALPFRLLILAASEERLDVWRKNTTITKMLAGYDQTAYVSSTDLPVRRIHLVAHASIHQACLNGMEKSPTANFLGADGWEAFVLQMYHLWLTAFKGIPEGGAWKLIIGFEREAGQVSTRWTGLKSFKASEQKSLNPSASMHIEVMVCEPSGTPQTSDGAGNMTWTKCSTQEERRSFLIFDNHGQVVKNADGTGVHSLLLNKSPFFYQDFKGSRELSLAQSLESPPQGPFAFGFWIYSIVEGSLLNVAILDERVAEASLVSDKDTGLQLHYLHKMHVVPLFKVSRSGNEKYVSPGVESHASEQGDVLAIDQQPPTIKWAWCSSSQGWQIMQVCSAHKPNMAIWPLNMLDAIIIHEGIVDAFLHKAWETEDETRLLALAPRVVRTSGRGSMPRHLARNLPFMEFSELSETIYRSRNKPGLAKAVCSVAGPMPEPAKGTPSKSA